MHNQSLNLDASTACSYIGRTVEMEVSFPEDPDPYWISVHVVGVVMPMEGVWKHGFFMVIDTGSDDPYPDETFFCHVRSIRAIGHRDRHGSGSVLDPMSRTLLDVSGAALPAHRNGSVPMNGSTGAAHP